MKRYVSIPFDILSQGPLSFSLAACSARHHVFYLLKRVLHLCEINSDGGASDRVVPMLILLCSQRPRARVGTGVGVGVSGTH